MDPRKKYPELAGFLSLLPGLGHMYAQAYITGLIWLVISAVIIFLIIYIFPILFLICYIILILKCIPEAITLTAEHNARIDLHRRFAIDKKTEQELKRIQDEFKQD
ncbi:MAG: hypothetical protein ACE14V_04855 [bacterium]